MASILSRLNIAKKKCDDLIYFVEDDYIHKKESLNRMMVLMYEKLASLLKSEVYLLCTVIILIFIKKQIILIF